MHLHPLKPPTHTNSPAIPPPSTDPPHHPRPLPLLPTFPQVMDSVGLSDVPLNIPPSALSGGQQRRLALAIQLVRQPSLLLLDEPLSGLDWRARAEVVELLRAVKRHCTLLVVSHDLREIAELVDVAWRMRMGGRMEAVAWPPGSLTDLEEEGKETGDEGRLWGSDAYY